MPQVYMLPCASLASLDALGGPVRLISSMGSPCDLGLCRSFDRRVSGELFESFLKISRSTYRDCALCQGNTRLEGLTSPARGVLSTNQRSGTPPDSPPVMTQDIPLEVESEQRSKERFRPRRAVW